MKMLITVGTPFYGTGNHIHRYYRGEDPLNIIYGIDKFCRLAESMPGPYILMYMDRTSFKKYNETIKNSELDQYPFIEMGTIDKHIDPYSKNSHSRYPIWINKSHLAKARLVRAKLDQIPPRPVIDRVFHIRSKKNLDTNVKLYWEKINGIRYDPYIWDRDNLPFPLVADKGKGDGTVPFWSARMAQTPDDQVFTLKNASEHEYLLEHPETLIAIKRTIKDEKVPSSVSFDKQKIPSYDYSSEQEVEDFLKKVKSKKITREHKNSIDPRILRTIYDNSSLI